MKKRQWLVAGAIVLLLGGGWWTVSRVRAQAAPAGETGTTRQGVEITVYNEDFAQVREVRPQSLSQGNNKLHVLEVSKLLDPQSVALHWQGEGNSLPQLIAQAYDLGVGSGDNLLKRYLGQKVEVVRYGQNGHESERQQGVLMVEGNGGLVLQSDGKFYVNPSGTIVAPTNSDIIMIPQLSVQADSPSAQSANLEVAYLTRGLSWTADYVATLSPKQDAIALECWATVTNRTGVDYPGAKVSLVAGAPNRAVVEAQQRAQDAGGPPDFEASRKIMKPSGSFGGMASSTTLEGGMPQRVGDFHAYKIKNATTVVQEQMNRLLMFSSANLSVKKDYNTRPPQLGAWEDVANWAEGHPAQRSEVAVALSFANTEQESLGLPLPQGAIRVYEPDSAGSLRYIGAASVENTPAGEKVYITLARAFDVFIERRMVKSRQIDKHTVRKTVELTLHNEKANAVDLRVAQGFEGRWKMFTEPQKHTSPDATLAQWIVSVPANSKPTFNYSVDLIE